ncbi:hypothetical protein [Oceanobacillus halophilus]|uniref:Sporulation protein n=1 Tax=Oceanobacillus halophilus TaxID=930130 RepID=A0A495ABD5_9BACI|nr:hypothetical protein [Oceanobacillus halophilus]RKQ37318.1 hypothetical protein D8M06_00505 [Oceanobacillus halophilus]
MLEKNNLMLIIFVLVLLSACGNGTASDNSSNTNQNNKQQTVEINNISANKLIDQEPSNKAKDILKKHDEVTGIKGANTSNKLIIAVQIKHNKRFQLSKIKKELSKELKENFKNFHVELTIDKKIYLELEKLEEKIQSNSIKPGKLGKEIDRITKLSKEKT